VTGKLLRIGQIPILQLGAVLDMAVPAHFLSQVGLLFEVGCARFLHVQAPSDFGERTVSNRKQEVSRITGDGGGRRID
jgi:hypothetical protein